MTRRLGAWLVAVVGGGLGLALGVLALSSAAHSFFSAGTVGADGRARVELAALPTRSVVYAADGSVLGLLHAEENRVPVPLDRVPAHVVEAVLEAEDARFFDHGALDVRALLRATAVNLSEGEVSEGGSTITQQLVKTELLSPRQDLKRKVQEAALAIRLERRMSKQQILERYLNAVYFGNGAYGLQAAAERYFGTDVERLTRGQGILLAGLIRNPVFSDPFSNPGAARSRRDLIVDRMLRRGHLAPAEADAIRAEPMPTRPPDRPPQGINYFLDKVRTLLLADPRLGATEGERYQAVFKGGLAIHTSLDPRYQKAAEAAVARIVPDTKGRFTAALVSVDPATGAVRALVGGSGFERSQVNLADFGTGRQTGSAFKTFTLLAALEQGYRPDDLILGSEPCPIPNPGGIPNPWTPSNVEGQAPGVLTLAEATVRSVNCAYARLVSMVGPDKVVDMAKRMGINSPLAPQLSITLGAQEVTPLQMASAYATLAADGERRHPYLIERVADRQGRVLFEADKRAERVLAPHVARVATSVLSDVVAKGTGRAAGIPRRPAAGKTGSTDSNVDAWFVGFTPELTTAVWMGSPQAQVPMYNVGGVPRVYGGTFPARVWGSYTAAVLAGRPTTPFAPPPPLENRPPRYLLAAPADLGRVDSVSGQTYVLPGGVTVSGGDRFAPPFGPGWGPGGGIEPSDQQGPSRRPPIDEDEDAQDGSKKLKKKRDRASSQD